jgi:integrase
MTPELEARLKQQLEKQRRAQLEGKPLPEWVFPSPRGHFWSERNFSRTWERLRRRFLKLGVRPLKFHCARHTFITWALESGKSAKRISTWVGASEEVIQSNYSHLLPDDDGVDFLGAVFDTEKPHQNKKRIV